MTTTFRFSLALALLAGTAGPAIADAHPAGQQAAPAATTQEDTGREAPLGQRIRMYSADQRDSAVQQARTALDAADRELDGLDARMHRQWDTASADVRASRQAALERARRSRLEVASWFGGLKYGSANAWPEVRGGFARSYEALTDSLRRAREAFEQGRQQTRGERPEGEQAPPR